MAANPPEVTEVMDKLYTVEETAELLRVSTRTVRNYIKDGKLRASKLGKQYVIRESDINALLETEVYKPE